MSVHLKGELEDGYYMFLVRDGRVATVRPASKELLLEYTPLIVEELERGVLDDNKEVNDEA